MEVETFISQLSPTTIKEVETLKKKARIYSIILYVLLGVWIINFIISIIRFSSPNSNFGLHFLIAFILFAIAGVFVFLSTRFKKKFLANFDHSINKLIVESINNNWYYSPSEYVKESTYTESELIRPKHDDYTGEGFISAAGFASSLLHAGYSTGSHDDSTFVTTFSGLFIHVPVTTICPFDIMLKSRHIYRSHNPSKMVHRHDDFKSDDFDLFSEGTESIDTNEIYKSKWFIELSAASKQYNITVLFLNHKCFCAVDMAYSNKKPSIWKKGIQKSSIENSVSYFTFLEKVTSLLYSED